MQREKPQSEIRAKQLLKDIRLNLVNYAFKPRVITTPAHPADTGPFRLCDE